jgi:hypothetical protein
VAWLRDHAVEATPSLIAAILGAAKQTSHVLSNEEITRVIQASAGEKSSKEAAI